MIFQFTNLCVILLILCKLNAVREVACELTERGFADKFGLELREFSQIITKYQEIVGKYKSLNARVDTNDGRNLTGQITDNVNGFLKRIERAVRCIQEAAESAAISRNFSEFDDSDFMLEYYNMKFFGQNDSTLEWLSNYTNYPDMSLSADEQFYNILVNTNHSAVHVPTNLYDRYPHVAETIIWSKDLDPTFLKNFENDPSLKWQYFGASSGMMRLFPAMEWRQNGPDLYDCRTQDWYIEAATCTKDMLILMDTSGSMTGMRNTIANLVVHNLLDTLGNNDFVNVYNYSSIAAPIDDCIIDLIQATKENVLHLKKKVADVVPNDTASVPEAFEAAFMALKKARERRGCDNPMDCHQAIMLITDGLPGNITDVFEEFNRLPDGNIPVRVFTYLIGLEVQGVNEMQDIACENRGYYTHIHDLDEVRDQVLKYISVIARPLALYADEHPVRWTHIFVDTADGVTYEEYKTMISVSVPVYGNRSDDNETNTEYLLTGVAGSDVLVEDIFKLTYPYKIGANGYAFLLTNNGYIILHPDLRPVSNGTLKNNFASIDLIDVEFAADDNVTSIEELRDDMVRYNEGDKKNITIKFHYDNFRRVGIEKRDYYYSPLPGTPYTIGLAIPSVYGNYQIGIGDEVHKIFLVGDSLEKYFEGNLWRLHPDWFYCGFNNGTDSISQEETFLQIIKSINQWNWKKLKEQVKQSKTAFLFSDDESVDCERPVYEDIFDKNITCDIDLLQLVMFDAKLTSSFKKAPHLKNVYEKKLFPAFNATLRFIATQSGLLRWKNLPEDDFDETLESKKNDLEFGDLFPRSIEESWFKAAVLQYNIDTRGEYQKDGDSFVFSAPYFNERKEINEVLLTATIAIFPRDGGRKAPASVLGYQLTYQSFKKKFEELSKAYSVSCNYEDNQNCYLLDHNAYVIHDSQKDTVGKFFGDVDSAALNELDQAEFYAKSYIMDYQALCIVENSTASAASFISQPWMLFKTVSYWFTIEVLWGLLLEITYAPYALAASLISDDYFDESLLVKEYIPVVQNKSADQPPIVNMITKPCFKQNCLWLRANWDDPYKREENKNSRLISARNIPHTNLLLVTVDLLYLPEQNNTLTFCKSQPLIIEETLCQRHIRTEHLKRRPLASCKTFHPDEGLSACGLGSEIKTAIHLLLFLVLLLLIHLH